MFTQLTLVAALTLGAPALKDKEPLGTGPGYMGITFQKDDMGVLVTDVKPESPAAKAGVKTNDLILAAEHNSLKDADTGDFVKMVAGMRPGSILTLDVKRGSEKLVLKVKLGVRPKDFSPRAIPNPPPIDPIP